MATITKTKTSRTTLEARLRRKGVAISEANAKKLAAKVNATVRRGDGWWLLSNAGMGIPVRYESLAELIVDLIV